MRAWLLDLRGGWTGDAFLGAQAHQQITVVYHALLGPAQRTMRSSGHHCCDVRLVWRAIMICAGHLPGGIGHHHHE